MSNGAGFVFLPVAYLNLQCWTAVLGGESTKELKSTIESLPNLPEILKALETLPHAVCCDTTTVCCVIPGQRTVPTFKPYSLCYQ